MDTIHKGQDNTYSFIWKNKKILSVLPVEKNLKEQKEIALKPTKPTMLGITGSKLHKEGKAKSELLALLIKEVGNTNQLSPII